MAFRKKTLEINNFSYVFNLLKNEKSPAKNRQEEENHKVYSKLVRVDMAGFSLKKIAIANFFLNQIFSISDSYFFFNCLPTHVFLELFLGTCWNILTKISRRHRVESLRGGGEGASAYTLHP